MELTKETILESINEDISFTGNSDLIFKGIKAIDEAEEGYISWIKPNTSMESETVNSTIANGIICTQGTYDLYKGSLENKLFLITDTPKKIFVAILRAFFGGKHAEYTGVHESAIIHPDCKIGDNVSIGAFSIIGACEIGDNTKIYNNVTIFDPVTIGKNCIIRENCSIGGEGCGVQKDQDGINLHIPHVGYVIIEDNVQIFPYCNVDRGNLGLTKVGKNTFLDHYVYVSHNSIIGENNIITGRTSFCGGSQIGDNCFLGVNTLIKEKVQIGNNVYTGLGSVIINDIKDNEVWVGNPAKFLRKNE